MPRMVLLAMGLVGRVGQTSATACRAFSPGRVVDDSSARLLDQFFPRRSGDQLAVQAQRLHTRPDKLEVPHRDAEKHHMIGIVSRGGLQQGRRDLTVAMSDQDEPGTASDLGGRVDGQACPVLPVVPAAEHDRHAGGPQRHPGIGVVRLSSSIHRDI